MVFQNIFKLFLKRLYPFNSVVAMYATTSMFINADPPKTLNSDQKLQFEILNLSYDNLLKQSTINAVNSASQTLTITYTAIETTSKEYRQLLTKLIMLMNQAILQEVTDAHWDEILEVRSLMQEKKQIIMKFINYVDYVHKMSEAASEISYLAGMDNLSTTLAQRIDDALTKIQTEKTNNYELEKEYIRVQEESIRSGGFLCTDRDANIILGMYSEYLSENSEARALGLVMVPGRHIVTIRLDI